MLEEKLSKGAALWRLTGLLFVVCAPLFLISASVTWAVNDAGLYRRGFEKYQISVYSGITDADLAQVGADLRRYFNSSEEPLRVFVPVYGLERELFNQREVDHMRDVKGLVRGVYAVALITGLYLLGFIVAGYWRQGRPFSWSLALRSLQGGLFTLAVVVAIGLFALVGFDTLFLLFHRVSFANDLWQLDPRTDYLLIMFPLGFWFDATMRVALTTLFGAALLASSGGGYLLYRKKRTGDEIAGPPA